MVNVGIIVGSTRPGRHADVVAQWVLEHASSRTDAKFKVIDTRDFELPLLDEEIPPSQGKYSQAHTKRWAEAISACDAFIFVTPEYNHSTSGALKNAIDFLYKEWNNKAAAFVSYGSVGGSRAVEQLRQVMAELQIADVRAQVMFFLNQDFGEGQTFSPAKGREKLLPPMLDQLVGWGKALKQYRSGRPS